MLFDDNTGHQTKPLTGLSNANSTLFFHKTNPLRKYSRYLAPNRQTKPPHCLNLRCNIHCHRRYRVHWLAEKRRLKSNPKNTHLDAVAGIRIAGDPLGHQQGHFCASGIPTAGNEKRDSILN